MPLRETLQRITTEFPAARKQPLEAHPLARFIRDEAEQAIMDGLGSQGSGLIAQGSPGQGNWAAIPWIAIFDPAVTTSAVRGYYVVYLFHTTKPIVFLSLNQGTTSTRQEFGSRTREVLTDRAHFIRKRLPEFVSAAPLVKIGTGADARLPGDYAAGHSFGFSYGLAELPSETTLRDDLQLLIRAYRALTFRGGLDADIDADAEVSEFKVSDNANITEKRKYVLHKKIERNGTAAKAAKKHHGTVCQACSLNFGARYGDIGNGFIEAHHLTPISTLAEGIAVQYNVANDFAVLCSNCHRMIHRTDDPSNLMAFRARLKI